jgi:hypothetical protein
MQQSLRMRVTQILERSKINTVPITVTFKTKNVWYAFMYWLLQAIILAIIYNGTMWFLPLFNLITVGWAWDKITTGNLSESVFKPDIESGISESSIISETHPSVLTEPSVFIPPVKNHTDDTNNNAMFEPVDENDDSYSYNPPNTLFSDNLISSNVNNSIDNIKRAI